MEMYKTLSFHNGHLEVFDGLKSTSDSMKSKYNEQPINSVSISTTVEKCCMKICDDRLGLNLAQDDNHPELGIGITTNDEFIVERLNEKTKKRSILVYNATEDKFYGGVIGLEQGIMANSDNVSKELYLYAMFFALLDDDELKEGVDKFITNISITDYANAWETLFIISDNIYRRLRYKGFSNCDTDDTQQISGIDIDTNKYVVETVLCGEFHQLPILQQHTPEVTVKINKEDFIGKYAIDSHRTFTEEEKRLMDGNVLDDYYIIGDTDVEICMDIQQTTGESMPFRTFTLVGPPGTGKSTMVKAVANGIAQPSVIYNCHPNTEIFDFVGQVMPPDVDSADKAAFEFAAKIEELGGMNFKNIATVLKLPSADDVMYVPEDVYKDITGKARTESGKIPNTSDALKVYTAFMTQQFNDSLRKLAVAAKSGSNFRYTETDFIKAVKNGWTVEIQEPTVILNEGVLVGLNSLLAEGVITLPTGKVIERHRDNVVFFTTNVSLAGCRNMNQSLMDRSNEIFHVPMPSIDSMVNRAMSISGETDFEKVNEMAKIILDISDDLLKSGIDDGVCGMRSLVNWVIKSKYMDAYKAGISTVVNKSSLDDEARDSIMKHLTESKFYRNYKIK